LGLITCPIVKHQHIFQVRAEDFYEGEVVRVGEVNFPISLTFEGDEEKVGEAFVQAFGAIVDAPLKIVNDVYLFRQSPESCFHLGYAIGSALFLEGEQDGVAKK